MGTTGLAEYYDDLSSFELRRKSHSMHKRLRSAPSVDELIEQRVARSGARRLLDVGCGFGTTIARLSRLASLEHAHGLTLSVVQKATAERRAQSGKTRFFVANYEDPLPGTYDAMIAIESLVFATDLSRTHIVNLRFA